MKAQRVRPAKYNPIRPFCGSTSFDDNSARGKITMRTDEGWVRPAKPRINPIMIHCALVRSVRVRCQRSRNAETRKKANGWDHPFQKNIKKKSGEHSHMAVVEIRLIFLEKNSRVKKKHTRIPHIPKPVDARLTMT